MKNLPLRVLYCLTIPVLVACPGDDSPSQTESSSTGSDTSGGPPATSSMTMTTTATTTATTTGVDGTTTTEAGTTDSGGTTDEGSATDSGSTTEPEGTSTGEESTGSTGGSESGSTGMMVLDDTIYEIQDGTIASGVDVDVQGVIVTGVSGSGFFAQEPGGGQYSGVYVYLAAMPTVSVGDEVDLIGTTEEFNDLTEINASMGSVTPTGLTGLDPMPEIVPAADLTAMTGEPWEGVLVRIEGMPLTVSNLPGFDEFDVNDGGADDTRVDNFLHNVFDFPGTYPNFDLGATFTAIQGPLNYTFGEFKVAPREDADLEGYMEPPPPPPPAGFGDCATMDPMVACTVDEICIVDMVMMPTVGICTQIDCMNAGECPPAPPGGDAPVVCQDVNGDGTGDCMLDCSGGQTCPTGTNCFGGFLCVWPA